MKKSRVRSVTIYRYKGNWEVAFRRIHSRGPGQFVKMYQPTTSAVNKLLYAIDGLLTDGRISIEQNPRCWRVNVHSDKSLRALRALDNAVSYRLAVEGTRKEG